MKMLGKCSASFVLQVLPPNLFQIHLSLFTFTGTSIVHDTVIILYLVCFDLPKKPTSCWNLSPAFSTLPPDKLSQANLIRSYLLKTLQQFPVVFSVNKAFDSTDLDYLCWPTSYQHRIFHSLNTLLERFSISPIPLLTLLPPCKNTTLNKFYHMFPQDIAS